MNTSEIRARLDQALKSPAGVSIDFPNERDAISFRMHAYALRRRDAALSGDDRSPYDTLSIRIMPPAVVLIEHRAPIPPATDLPDESAPKVIRLDQSLLPLDQAPAKGTA